MKYYCLGEKSSLQGLLSLAKENDPNSIGFLPHMGKTRAAEQYYSHNSRRISFGQPKKKST